jgi:hypothetical protein
MEEGRVVAWLKHAVPRKGRRQRCDVMRSDAGCIRRRQVHKSAPEDGTSHGPVRVGFGSWLRENAV